MWIYSFVTHINFAQTRFLALIGIRVDNFQSYRSYICLKVFIINIFQSRTMRIQVGEKPILTVKKNWIIFHMIFMAFKDPLEMVLAA